MTVGPLETVSVKVQKYRRGVAAVASTLILLTVGGSVFAAPDQVTVRESVSASTVTSAQLSRTIADNARSAAVTAASNARTAALPAAQAQYSAAMNNASAGWMQSYKAASAQYVQAYNNAIRAATYTYRTGGWFNRSYGTGFNYNTFSALLNQAVNNFYSTMGSANNQYYAAASVAAATRQTTINNAVSTAVVTAVANSMAATVSEAGVSMQVANDAVIGANQLISSPAFVSGIASATGVSASVLQSATARAGTTVVAALTSAASSVPGAVGTQNTVQGGPPSPQIVVYRS